MPFMSDFLGGLAAELERQQEEATFLRLVETVRQRHVALLSLDRGAAMQHLSAVVQRSSAKELGDFERNWLLATTLLEQPEEVRKSVELYGFYKSEERERFGMFCGFADER